MAFGDVKPSDVAVLVSSCDRYADLWRPYFHCFFKYWPDCPYPVFLGSNIRSFADSRVTSLPIGEDRDYSSNLLRMLDRIPQDWVIITVDDRFICSAVDTRRVDSLIRAAQHEGAGYYKLISEYPLAYESDPSRLFGEIPRGVRYRISFTVALWKKSVLLKILRPGETAWEIERLGTARAEAVPEKFFAPSVNFQHEPPLDNFHGVVKGKWARATPAFLEREGLSGCIPHRELLPLWREFYGWLYHLRLDVFIKLRRHWRSS